MDDIQKYILLDNLFNVYLDSNFDEEDEQIFNSDRVNVDEIVLKNIKLFKQLRTQSKAEINRIKHNRVLDFLSELRRGIKSNIKEYQEIAEKILSKPEFAELHAMFRNFEYASEEDKRSMVFDAELLNMLSDIEEEYNRKPEDED